MSEPMPKHGKSKQDWGTPPELLAAIKGLLGIDEFCVDLAANRDNTVARAWYGPGGMSEDSLDGSTWLFDEWAWCNPPFADIEPWARKAAEWAAQGARIAVLVPASVDANWWADHVEGKARVLALAPRITFVGATAPYPKPVALLLYDRAGGSGIHQWRWKARR